MEKAVIGIIGCGNIAKDVHLDDAFSNPRIRGKWCCDIMQENLDYVTEKYGSDHVCQIITFGTLIIMFICIIIENIIMS